MPDAITVASPLRPIGQNEAQRDLNIRFLQDGRNRMHTPDGCVGFNFLLLAGNNRADMVNIDIPNNFRGLPKGQEIPTIGIGPEDTLKINSANGAYTMTTVKRVENGVHHANIFRFDFNKDNRPDLEVTQWTPQNQAWREEQERKEKRIRD